MNPRLSWFVTFLLRSVAQRRGRIVIAGAAVTLAVGVIAGMIALSLGMRAKLGKELKAYGANVLVTARPGSPGGLLQEDALSRLRALSGSVDEITAQIYGQGRIGGSPVEVVGCMFADLAGRGWKLKGHWPAGHGEVVLGTVLAGAAGIDPGALVEIAFDRDHGERYRVTGILERGGSEDRAVLMDMEEARTLLGIGPGYATFFIRSRGPAEEAADAIARALPEGRVKSLKQVASAEEEVLRKIELLMLLVTLVVLVGSVIAVASTMGATVLERREEIGLERALGGTRRQVAAFFAAEAGLIGVIGGVTGLILGAASAELISRGAFGSWIPIPLWLPLAALPLGIGLAVLSGHPPVRNAMRPSVSEVLRGE